MKNSYSTAVDAGSAAPAVSDLQWNDLIIILAICRAGTLAGAARSLNMDHSTIYRKINAIEKNLGVRFFERLASGYAKTESGEIAMQYAERIETEFHALSREILGRDEKLQGKIYLTSAQGVATLVLPTLLEKFCRQNPLVSIDLNASVSAFDLSRREADIAIRATSSAPPDTSLGRKVCNFNVAIYASLKYLENNPVVIDVGDHRWITIDGTRDWLIPTVWKNRVIADANIIANVSSLTVALNMIRADSGVTVLPCHAGDLFEDLTRISDPLQYHAMELWILTHPDLRHTARVKALMTFLYEELYQLRDLFEGNIAN
jgi:DNA-binding transcriptional LysR family regulator